MQKCESEPEGFLLLPPDKMRHQIHPGTSISRHIVGSLLDGSPSSGAASCVFVLGLSDVFGARIAKKLGGTVIYSGSLSTFHGNEESAD